jgi:pyridinium-3,5-biscarboxylic acid mononucleotide synthase
VEHAVDVDVPRTADLGFARLDLDRAVRTGTPEVVYPAGKTPEQTVACLAGLLDGGAPGASATRVDGRTAAPVLERWPDADADAVVVAAGMHRALPSVVAGLTDRLVVAVPTSVGHGGAFDGLAALLTMLTACAPGVLVVNIDNGFGAGVAAARIVRSVQR